MKISNSGISLNLLIKEDIEFLNQKIHPVETESVAELPESLRFEISNEWFEHINYIRENYYLIEYQGNKIGLLFNKNMDWEMRSCETELFFWKDLLTENSQMLACWLTILEFLFYYLEWSIVSTHVLNTKTKAIEIIESLGFTLNAQGNRNELQASLTREQFNINALKAGSYAQSNLAKDTDEGFLLLEPLDYESGIAQKIENHFLETGIYLHRRGISGSRKYFR